jgi:hypothetical protein
MSTPTSRISSRISCCRRIASRGCLPRFVAATSLSCSVCTARQQLRQRIQEHTAAASEAYHLELVQPLADLGLELVELVAALALLLALAVFAAHLLVDPRQLVQQPIELAVHDLLLQPLGQRHFNIASQSAAP